MELDHQALYYFGPSIILLSLGADGIVGALAAVLYHEVTLRMKASIEMVEQEDDSLVTPILDFLPLDLREREFDDH